MSHRPARVPATPPSLALLALLGLLGLLAARADAAAVGIVKSPHDPRSYEYLRLDNGLRVVLVSDPATDRAAASLDVNVGSGADPRGREGLAHFLEHMLFLGTEKYPQPGEYKDFMLKHGGGDNAYTAFDHTNYFFEVDADFLEPALDRFAQFFIAPLFNPEYVERERQVVHSEYTSNLNSDGRRLYHARKQAMNPEHPASRFSAGSLETLADPPGGSIRDELIAFYRRHYSAGIMTLSVLGREPLAVLREWVRARFGAIGNTGAGRQRIEVPLFAPGSLPARLDIVPIRDRRSLSLVFPVPPLETHFRTKPTRLIADLLGHEGPDSLLAALKRRGWAEALSAGSGLRHPDFATFEVSIRLTPAGLENVETVAALVFAELALIRDRGLEAWRYEEMARLAGLAFRFEEKPDPVARVRSIAGDLHTYPPPDVLRGGYLMEAFERPLTERYLEHLVPDNVLLVVMAPGLETDRVTHFYSVPYRLRPLPEALVARLRSARADGVRLALPPPNDFIPEDLAMRAGDATPVPVRIERAPGFALWHQTDTGFGLPQANLYVSVRSPVARDTARHAVLTELFTSLVNDRLDAITYAASLAGLHYSLYPHVRGFTIRVGGYSDKQDRLLGRILDAVTTGGFAPERFAVRKAELARRLRNAADDDPYRRALADLRHLVLVPHWTEEQRLEALGEVRLADLEAFARRLLERLDVVALAHGNLTADEARSLAVPVRTRIAGPARPATVERARVVRLDPPGRYLRRVPTREGDSALVTYFQGAEASYAARARNALLVQVLASPFFDVIRTEKRLGYVVFATGMTLVEVPGIAFIVQSPVASPRALEGHVREFLRETAPAIESMDEATFARHRAAVVSRILEEEKRLDDRTDRYWNELDRGETGFDSRERLAAAVRAVDRAALPGYYRSRLLGPDARSVSIWAGARAAEDGEPGPPWIPIEDPEAFKGARETFRPARPAPPPAAEP